MRFTATTFPEDEVRQEIARRNRLRSEAGMPVLSVDDELRRLKWAYEEHQFEEFFRQEAPKYQHLWCDRSRGFMGNMGIWASERNRLLREWKTAKRKTID